MLFGGGFGEWRFPVLVIKCIMNDRERAFGSNEFKNYNPRVELHVATLVDVLRRSNGKEINCSKAMDNLVFDM